VYAIFTVTEKYGLRRKAETYEAKLRKDVRARAFALTLDIEQANTHWFINHFKNILLMVAFFVDYDFGLSQRAIACNTPHIHTIREGSFGLLIPPPSCIGLVSSSDDSLL
jgi:hypothetical protein